MKRKSVEQGIGLIKSKRGAFETGWRIVWIADGTIHSCTVQENEIRTAAPTSEISASRIGNADRENCFKYLAIGLA